jgi:hypothetical protein
MVKRLKDRDMYYDATRVLGFEVEDVPTGVWPHIYFLLDNGEKVFFGRNFFDVEMATVYAEHFMKKFQEDEEELDLFFDF